MEVQIGLDMIGVNHETKNVELMFSDATMNGDDIDKVCNFTDHIVGDLGGEATLTINLSLTGMVDQLIDSGISSDGKVHEESVRAELATIKEQMLAAIELINQVM